MTVVLVLAGGALGAPLRYLTDLFVQGRHDSVIPWGTFSVNVVGSLLLGAIASAVAVSGLPNAVMTFAGTGLCGALTTFSTFGFETVRLLEEGSWMEAAGNAILSLVVGLGAVSLGWWLVAVVA